MNDQAQQVRVRKTFRTGKKALYLAWIEEAQLRQWWKPMNKELASVENEIKEGGKVVYTFSNDLKIHGQYKEVKEGEKLVYSWIWDLPEDSHQKGEYILTVLFKGDDTQSELEVLQESFQSQHSVKPHQDGWEEALQDLSNYLQTNG
jgi:uncharacterized protein YndB with AHSA1/START domain